MIIWSACELWASYSFVIMVQCNRDFVHSPPSQTFSRKFPSIMNREKTINRTEVIAFGAQENITFHKKTTQTTCIYLEHSTGCGPDTSRKFYFLPPKK